MLVARIVAFEKDETHRLVELSDLEVTIRRIAKPQRRIVWGDRFDIVKEITEDLEEECILSNFTHLSS